MKSQTQTSEPSDIIISPKRSLLINRLVIAGLICLFGVVYLTTLLPGVSSGDSAELQYASVVIGSCHPPGYQIEVSIGKLFSLLPLGPGIAWRINFMMVVFGTAGCLAFYGAIRRICGFVIPAVIAASTLGFSSVFWTHCLYAEAYVFYASFLLFGFYTIVRFVESNKAVWLYLTALFLGICVADRASELFVIPAFLLVVPFVWKKVRFRWVRLPVALLIFVLPFVYTCTFFAYYNTPGNLCRRDTVLRMQIVADNVHPPVERSFSEKLRRAYWYCLGLNYKRETEFSAERGKIVTDHYGWLISGRGVFGEGNRYPVGDDRNTIQGKGASIGFLGILLVITSIVLCRKNYGWVLLGVGMFCGNLFFIIWHFRRDGLTFSIPSLIGLSILVGLGAAGPASWKREKRRFVFQAICLAAPLFLLVGNYRLLDMSTDETRQQQRQFESIVNTPFPEGSVIIDACWPSMTYRYLFFVEADRKDLQIIYADPKDLQKVIKYFSEQKVPVFLRSYCVPQSDQRVALTKLTPAEIVRFDFVQINPQSTR